MREGMWLGMHGDGVFRENFGEGYAVKQNM